VRYGNNQPAVYVSWDAAKAFADLLTERNDGLAQSFSSNDIYLTNGDDVGD
jgi:hypothetical protein